LLENAGMILIMSMRSRNQHTLPFCVGIFWEIGQLEIWDVPFTSHGIKEITGEETENARLHDGFPRAKQHIFCHRRKLFS
jgi:hypothetical protein